MHFYRRPRTIFKGFKVPDWATAEKSKGWELDTYSRAAWDQALHEMSSEWTPTQFTGERLEPNVLQWLRFEQWGKGMSSRLFYNEVPKPNWNRHRGHLDDPEKNLYSFTHADQEPQMLFGIDTTTPEGREQFKKEWETACEIVPELISKDDMVYPHEHAQYVSNEPHFQRVWQHYRHHTFQARFAHLVSEGEISEEDAANFREFVDMTNVPTFNLYIYAKLGQLSHLEGQPGYQSTLRVMDKMSLGHIQFDRHSAQPYEEQFWDQYDVLMELSEEDMYKELPTFVTDPSNRAKVEALLQGRQRDALDSENTRQIEAAL